MGVHWGESRVEFPCRRLGELAVNFAITQGNRCTRPVSPHLSGSLSTSLQELFDGGLGDLPAVRVLHKITSSCDSSCRAHLERTSFERGLVVRGRCEWPRNADGQRASALPHVRPYPGAIA